MSYWLFTYDLSDSCIAIFLNIFNVLLKNSSVFVLCSFFLIRWFQLYLFIIKDDQCGSNNTHVVHASKGRNSNIRAVSQRYCISLKTKFNFSHTMKLFFYLLLNYPDKLKG